jgi:predicted Zn finger-like uncharacterized protein
MDVRCEKCLTVYELDDAKIGDVGLTVKCQECGNLFKVRRRADTAELVARAEAPSDPAHDTIDERGDERRKKKSESDRPPEATTKEVPVAPARGEERGWLLRSAVTRDVVQFRELTTLQQWIVERKVTRADEISRGGESWKALGGIAELASFFLVVEQAEAVANASMPGLAVQRGAKVDAGFGSESINDLPTAVVKPIGRRAAPEEAHTQQPSDEPITAPLPGAPAAPKPIADDSTLRLGNVVAAPLPHGYSQTLEIDGLPLRGDTRRRGPGIWGFLIFVTVLGVGAGATYFAMHGFGRGDRVESIAALLQEAHSAILLDTEDDFRRATAVLDRALVIDPSSIPARVELGQAHATWAADLLEDGRKLEQGAGSAGSQQAVTLRTEAQTHLDRARRVLEEPGAVETQSSPALARAFGELLRVEGAPATAVERFLTRAGQRGREDPELAYALAELALREGKTEAARAHLADAVKPTPETGPFGLARAQYRIAAIALASGRKDEATAACAALFKISPQHPRGKALCAFEASAPVAPQDASLPIADLAPPVVASKPTTPATPATPTAVPTTAPTTPASPPADYKSLVREADRLSENGHSAQARRLYERAIELDPRGVAALTGLGYCDLDAERFMQSVDRFNAALSVDPTAGDALLGLAESYKVRGQGARALEFYKRYLAAHPGGPKASMAQKNIRDLEPRASKETKEPRDPEGPDPSQERINEKVQIKTSDKPEAKTPPSEEPPP